MNGWGGKIPTLHEYNNQSIPFPNLFSIPRCVWDIRHVNVGNIPSDMPGYNFTFRLTSLMLSYWLNQ